MSNWLLDANFNKKKIENAIIYLKNTEIQEDVRLEYAINKKGDAYFLSTFFVDNINLDPLWAILAEFYKAGSEIFGDKNPVDNLYKIKDKLGTITIKRDKEIWTLTEAWPHSVNFGELCYSSDESVNVEVTWGCKEYKESQILSWECSTIVNDGPNKNFGSKLGISSRGVGN